MTFRPLALQTGVGTAMLLGCWLAACSPAADPDGSGGTAPTATGGAAATGGTLASGGSNDGPPLLTVEPVVALSPTPINRPILLDDGYVYYTAVVGEASGLWRVPKASGTANDALTQVTSVDGYGIYAIGGDEQHLYYLRDEHTEFVAGDHGWNGSSPVLHRVALDGPLPAAPEQLSAEPLGTGEFGLGSLLVQDESLFVVSYSDNARATHFAAYDKATGDLVYDDAHPGMTQIKTMVSDHATYLYDGSSGDLYSLNLPDGAMSLLGSVPDGCEVIGPHPTGWWFGTCIGETYYFARIDLTGQNVEVLLDNAWEEGHWANSLLSTPRYLLRFLGSIYLFDLATNEASVVPVPSMQGVPRLADDQFVYFTTPTSLWRMRYAE